MTILGLFQQKQPFLGFFAIPEPSREGGFTSTPRGGPPVASRDPEKGVFPGFPGEGPKRPFLGLFAPKSRFCGILALRAPPGPPGRPGVPRGPGARGWCKTPLAPRSGTRSRGSPGPPGPRSGLRGSPGPRRALPGPLRGPWTPSRGPGARGFTSTPRAGAPRFPGAVREAPPGPRGLEPLRRGLGWGSPVQGRRDPPAWMGPRRPEAAH